MKKTVLLAFVSALLLIGCAGQVRPPDYDATHTAQVGDRPSATTVTRMSESSYLDLVIRISEDSLAMAGEGSRVQTVREVKALGRYWTPISRANYEELNAANPPLAFESSHSELTRAIFYEWQAMEASADGDLESATNFVSMYTDHMSASTRLLP